MAAMAGERTARVQARIEAALRRIELAAQQPARLPDSELEQRFHDLWTRTNAALGDIDGLIAAIDK
ncbi:MAG: hypothetical protein ABIT09_04270 [Croceibacterium sp.]